MSADGEDLLTEEQRRLVDEATDRMDALLERAQRVAYEAMREAVDEVDKIRQRVLEAAGIEIVSHIPEKVPAPMDVRLDGLAELAEQCGYLLAAAELLAPHVQRGSSRTVGAVLKTSVDEVIGAAVLQYLNRSKFYAPEGETP